MIGNVCVICNDNAIDIPILIPSAGCVYFCGFCLLHLPNAIHEAVTVDLVIFNEARQRRRKLTQDREKLIVARSKT